LVFVLLFPVAAWKASDCPTRGDIYAYCPLYLWALFVPVFLLLTWWEWKCFKIVLVPFIQWLAPFNILGMKVSFRLWLAFTFMMSSTAKLDIATNSLFAAKMYATYRCPDSLWQPAQDAWHAVIESSIVAKFPYADKLIFICLLGWIIIVVQQALAFLMVHPWKGCRKIDYGWKSEARGYSTLWTRLFDTCYSRQGQVWHADVVRILAPAIRNLSIISQSCNWQMERVCKHLEMRGTGLAEQKRCFDMMYKETQHMVVNLWAYIIFERAVVMESQTSMYALIISLNQKSDHQIFFALLISFMTLIKALVDAHFQVGMLLRTHKQVMEDCKKLMDQQSEAENDDFTSPFEKFKAWLMGLPGPGDLPTQEDILLEARRAKIIIFLGMRLGTLALLLILVHAFVKLVMAPVCEYGFWNLPLGKASLARYGCVDLSGVDSIMKARNGTYP